MRVAPVVLAVLLAVLPLAAASGQSSLAVLQAARIASPATVDVTLAPAVVTLQIRAASPIGLSAVRFGLRSPSGHQTIIGGQELPAAPASFDGLVQTAFGGGGGGPHGLNLYSQPGTWTLAFVTVCDAARLCAQTSGAALAGLVSPMTVTVLNPGLAVTALPMVTSAAILTPSLAEFSPFPGEPSFSEVPAFQVAITAGDVAPGIVQAQARFIPPANPPCAGPTTPAVIARAPDFGVPATALTALLTSPGLSCFNATSLLGVYTLDRLRLADEAGNVLDITGPARLQALFPGGTTVTVTTPSGQ